MRLLALATLAPIALALGIAISATGSGALNPASTIGCLPALAAGNTAEQALKDLTPAALANAKTIYDVSVQMKLPVRAAVIGVATALQESYLKNMANTNVPKSLTLPHEGVGSDHDSVGIFQQRPLPPDGEGSWGTVKELMTPSISATKFFTKMRTIDDWQILPLTVVAQQVQNSAFPDAYAKHEPLATAIVNAITDGSLICRPGGPVSAQGWAKPVHGTFTSGFRTPERPDHDGVDVAAPKGTPVYAAGPGVVTSVKCSSPNCDIDGSLATPGCGWELTIKHIDQTSTRYCHLLKRPFVFPGEPVTGGQQIGLVGSSGNSTGPHLHFECYVAGSPVEPLSFMRVRGVKLG